MAAALADYRGRALSESYTRRVAKVCTKKAARPRAHGPHVADRVKIGDSDTVYLITGINEDSTQVRLLLEGANLRRFRVDAGESDLRQ
jgi:hypothetical protein